ncbi:MATE family efflux transporter [Butyrivibrio sp. LC3010]|uniref:MATE family efflux transporter n=1 Tax=Butyrivibrio sp. LC3010 TaxID=1280680 RepID=UPI00047CA7FB|nr:MATE family efflux transporter [Butyrivibrio sp. LC3010]
MSSIYREKKLGLENGLTLDAKPDRVPAHEMEPRLENGLTWDAESEQERTLTQEKELAQKFTFWSFFRFIAPSIFVFVFIAVYQIVDGLFIEKFIGDLAIASINLYFPIITMIIAVGVMIGTGGNAMIVLKVGEGKRKQAGETFSRIIVFSVLLGLAITVLLLLFADSIMRLCGATDGNIIYLKPYYITMSCFVVTVLLQSEFGILIIGEGKSVVAAVVIVVGGTLNCVLDYVFMKHLNMGISGAAIATVIGYSSTVIYAIWFYCITKKSSYTFELAKPDFQEIIEVCYNGSSDMVANLAQAVTVLFCNHLAYRYYGETGVSALAVVTYIQVFIMMVFMGVTSAVEPVFSFNYGSGNIENRKNAFKFGMIWSVILGTGCTWLLFIFGRQIVSIFFTPGTGFYEIAYTGYILTLPGCLFVGINILGSGIFTAFSNGMISAMLSGLRTFVILTACLFGLSALMEGEGLWLAWAVAEAISLILTVFVLRKYKDKYNYL